MAVLDTTNMSFSTWIGLLKQDWPNANIPDNVDETEWQKYAYEIIFDPSFSAFVPPTPDVYAEPTLWMRAFSNAIY